jgi:hypothetical protein
MELEGYTRPFSPGGVASILEAPPPYVFSITQLVVHFRTDENALNQLIPSPLEPWVSWGGQAFWMATDHLMTPVDFPSAREWHPERSRFLEATLAIPCLFRESPGLFYCYAWVDREWALLMEWLTGMCGKLARVSMTTTQPDHPGLSGTGRGARFAATVERLGASVAKAEVVLEETATERPFDKFLRVYAIRHIPDFAAPVGRPIPLVHQIVTEKFGSSVRKEVWRGQGNLIFGDAENEWLLPVQPIETLGGYYLRSQFRSEGMEILYDYLAQREDSHRREK